MRSHELLAGQAWLLTELPRLLLALIVGVLAPRALLVAGAPPWLVRAGWAAGAMAAAGLVVVARPGVQALALTLPYALVTIAAGACGAARLAGGLRPMARTAVALGLVFLPAAATWLCAARAGYPLLGYAPFWVLATAAHFHVAGSFLAILAGRVALERGRVRGALAAAIPAAVALTAAGIWGPRWLEVAAAWLTAALTMAFGVALVRDPDSARRKRLARVAGLSLLLTMPLALLFASRGAAPPVRLLGLDELSSMLVAHGAINTVVFATCGLYAWASQGLADTALVRTPPMSRLAGGWHIGASFLSRSGLLRAEGPPPTGLVDSLEELAHPGLDPRAVSDEIRAFYEHTADHEMIVEPTWRWGFRTAARAWASVAHHLGQLQLPWKREPTGLALRSAIVAVSAQADGRAAPRSWIRTYPDGRALYVAVYSTHVADGRAYMNIAFPLPRGNLTSILRMDAQGHGVTVTTRSGGDCGIWLVLRLFRAHLPLRLPLAETIDVWTTADEQAPPELRAWATGYTLIARHRLWLFGVRYLELRYAMRRAPTRRAFEPG